MAKVLRPRWMGLACLACAAGCGSAENDGTLFSREPEGGSAAIGESGPVSPSPEPPDLTHTFEPVQVDPGEEITGLCQSWTLGNAEALFINRVAADNLGAFHHSNWIWVPEANYPGPDGTWPCADRNFDQIVAGAIGGVFFAQSTQSRTDTQAFPDGVAFEMPSRVRIIGDVHLLNASGSAATTSLSFEIFTLPAAAVRVKLQPMAFTNMALDIAPSTETHARMQCATPQPDFDVYYVLPHYHTLGKAMRVDVAGGAMNGMSLFGAEGTYGEPSGETYDPPIHVAGAAGLAITCEYENPRAAAVRYGFGDQEMCVSLVYSTGKKAGGMALTNLTVMDVGGVHHTDALCVSVGAP